MADSDSRKPGDTALARRGRTATEAARASDTTVVAPGPALPVQRTMRAMLRSSADAFGQVVNALLLDLDQVSESMDRLGWLATTSDLVTDERALRAAAEQLRWWEGFLGDLPLPQLLSEQVSPERRRALAERARVQALARDRAATHHRERVQAVLAQDGHSLAEREKLRRILEDPDATEWWVDPDAYVREALARLPPLPEPPPISARDLDASQSFSGFNAARAMREHELLAPRAAHLDQELTRTLTEQLRLPPQDAARHARVLTDMFWLALRRALEKGGHQLATALHLFVTTGDAEIQEQFSRELLASWLAYLEALPQPRKRLGLGERLGITRRREEPRQIAETGQPAHKQLTAEGQEPSRGLWSRIRSRFRDD